MLFSGQPARGWAFVFRRSWGNAARWLADLSDVSKVHDCSRALGPNALDETVHYRHNMVVELPASRLPLALPIASASIKQCRSYGQPEEEGSLVLKRWWADFKLQGGHLMFTA